MSEYKSRLVRDLVDRGYLNQATDIDGLDKAATEGVVTAYIGFDATASSLHVGSLVQIMMLRRIQQAGHKPIILMGGGTTKIGDPSGKDKTRSMLDDAAIEANIQGILKPSARWSPSAKARRMPSSSIMTNGCPNSAIWNSCANSARTSPSTG